MQTDAHVVGLARCLNQILLVALYGHEKLGPHVVVVIIDAVFFAVAFCVFLVVFCVVTFVVVFAV